MRIILPLPASHLLQVLPRLLTERGSGHSSVVLAQSEVTSEELGAERKVQAGAMCW
mgnify:CR=1 FL=1